MFQNLSSASVVISTLSVDSMDKTQNTLFLHQAIYFGQYTIVGYLSHLQAAEALTSLHIHTVLTDSLLLAYNVWIYRRAQTSNKTSSPTANVKMNF